MNIAKTKGLYAKLEELVKDLPWLCYAPVREAALKLFVLKLRLSTGNAAVFQEMKLQCQDIARKLGKSWQSVFVYQCVYDVFQRNVTIASACTVGSHNGLLIRFMDWGVPENVSKYTVKTTMKADDGSKYTNIGFPGFIGTVTALGTTWAVCMNQSPVAGNDDSGVPACYYSRLFANRFAAAMNSGRPLRAAVKSILAAFEEESIRPMSSCILVVRNSTHHGSIEFVIGLEPSVTIKPVSTAIAITNHMNSKENLLLNPDAEYEDEDGDLVENDTYERQAAMLKVLKKLAKGRRIDLDKAFLGIPEPILNELTAYAVLMDFKSGRSVVRKE